MSEYEELVSERQQMLEEAIEKAEAGKATWEDWYLLRAELGLQPNHKLDRS